MKQIYDDINRPEVIELCVEAIRGGKIVCVPTDTVYGLVCSPFYPEAIDRIVRLKQRSPNKPFALFVSSWDSLAGVNAHINTSARRLAQAFWPGALTILVPADDDCPCSSHGLVGARCPDYPFLLSVLDKCSGILVNTSLNQSGESVLWSLENGLSLLSEVDVVINGGFLPPRPASTVIDCSQNPPRIVREGGVSRDAIHIVLDNADRIR